MANNQTNPYLSGMGGMNPMGVNPTQITPQMYQQFMQTQQQQQSNNGGQVINSQQFAQVAQMNNNGGGNGNNGNGNGNGSNQLNFSGVHQAYQRLQSAESQKIEQQRLGMGFPGTAAPGQYQQLLALQSQSNMGNVSPTTNTNAMMGAINYPTQHQQQQQQMQSQQHQQSQQQQQQPQNTMGMNMGNQGGGLNLAQIQQMLQIQQQQQQAQQQQQQQQQGGQGGMNQGTNALGMGGMGSGMNIHSQNQGLNLQALNGDSEQGRRNALQNMLQSGGLTAQQQQNMFQGMSQQQLSQQFNPSPNQQNAQMSLPPNMQGGNNGGQNFDFTAQQLEQFFRQNPDFEKGGNRNQAIQQLMQKVRQGGVNSGAASGQGQGQNQGQAQQTQQPQQQRQQPHAVGLNGFAGQQGQNPIAQQQQQQQRQMSGQPTQQQMPPQQQQQQQVQQRIQPNDPQYNLAAQQFQNANMGNDAQRQIEALQAMKSRQRSGLVTPQMGNGNALPLTSPQPVSQSMGHQQSGGMTNNPNLTPSHHHRTLSQSSGVQPQMSQQMSLPQPQQQSQQSQGGKDANATLASTFHGFTEENLAKATSALMSKIGSNSSASQVRSNLLQVLTEYKRRHLNLPQPLIDGLSQVFPGHYGSLLGLEYSKLQAMVFSQNSTSSSKQQQQPPTTSMIAGSQSNPVDITTPSLPVMNNNIPQFAQQPAGAGMSASNNGQIAPPPPPQRQPSSSGPQSGQTNPQQQWQQQQLQAQAQAQGTTPLQIQQSLNRARPWAGQDFRNDPFPVPEDRFMSYLASMLQAPNLSPPLVQNKMVDLYSLFNLVHKNGGSVQLEGNIAAWSNIAGLLGFGETTQSGPAARSSPNIAIQIAQVHAKYLTRLEDMFYKNQFEERLKAAQNQQNQQQGSGPGQQASVLPPNAQQQMSQAQSQPQISTQFLEAVARGGNGMNMLNDQQRRALEGRKQSSSTQAPGQNQTPGGSMAIPGLTQAGGRPQTDQGILQAMKQNPKMAAFWVKSKEEAVRQRLCELYPGGSRIVRKESNDTVAKSFGVVPDEVKAKFVTDAVGLPQLAGDAQSKMTRFFMVAVERTTNPAVNANTNCTEDCNALLTLIQLYTSVQIMMAHASQDRFMMQPGDLNRIRDQIGMITNKFSGYMSELLTNPETAQSLSKLLAAAEQSSSSVGPPSLPRQSPAAMEEMASKLPKGLRVEDLKPPPAKRQKGKAGQSPSVQTPDNPKTPSVIAESPAPIPGSAQSSKRPGTNGVNANTTAAGNKRKRTISTANIPKSAKASEPAPIPALSSTKSLAVQPVDQQKNEYRAIFDARAALEDGTADPLEAIAAALRDLESAQAEAALRNNSISVNPTYGLFPSTNVNGSINKTGAVQPGPSDDELFNEFLDFNGDQFPTPELLVDISDDYSPESIRTVGRSDSVGQGNPGSGTSWSFGPGAEASTPAPANGNNNIKPEILDQGPGDDDEEAGMADHRIEIPQSPSSRHYNGPLYFQ